MHLGPCSQTEEKGPGSGGDGVGKVLAVSAQDLNLNPKLGTVACACNPTQGLQIRRQGQGLGWVLEIYWATILTRMVSSRLTERACLTKESSRGQYI